MPVNQTGMATTGQGSQTGAAGSMPSNLDPSRPWEYSFHDTGASKGPLNPYDPNLIANAMARPSLASYQQGFGGAQYSNGPQGQGIYAFNSPEQNALKAKQYYAKGFRNNLPGMENQMGHSLADAGNTQMQGSLDQNAQNNSRRGLLYGGINQGQQGQIRANTAKSVAQGQSDINSGLESAANNMDQSAINSGFQLQAQQQAIQNQLYKQAMASMSSTGNALSAVGGALGAVAGAYFTAGTGTAAGAAAGAGAGSAAGKAI